ncbi:PhoPQ-activated pathogenicity-related family protein [Steroidobacter agaridevorans]|uniref:PhoPQ-activated pathogenicity-related family protein n=1 Tax=Steroidobacter agaridevorans TaxID=2695856 RepID=UPI001320BCED|nr:PhoPQ-activated protein PqaA family protein [Steroidobacter agaridevorans]GFE89957.1 PhoPQ-activated pathogenicity protein [Steroidobacter agaridevorans]
MAQFRILLRDFLLITVLACAAFAPTRSSERATPGELMDYVARPDESFSRREVKSGRIGSAEYVEYLLTSQTWRGIPWKHQLFVLRPANMNGDARHALLFIHGGRWKPEYEGERKETQLPREAALFARLAESIQAPVAVLRQVPFQPLFDRKEDALIAYTFDQYLRTGESDWPLLLPMVKSATRAMDAVQSIAQERWGATLDSFTVAGASKRGWTAWLTAAVDGRVMAVAPMVIDVLNMRAQMEYQRATWGDLSEQISDYSSLDLPRRLETERGSLLLSIVDPFSYREQLTLPKLILLSTNDRYWPLDALKFYWPELQDPKNVLYVPNQGHGLRDVDRVIGGLSAVHRYAAAGKPLPRTAWSIAVRDRNLIVTVRPERPPRRVIVWSARSSTRDFRDAHWSSHPCEKTRDGYVCSTQRGEKGYRAVFAETAFRDPGSPVFSTTTTVCLVGSDENETPAC